MEEKVPGTVTAREKEMLSAIVKLQHNSAVAGLESNTLNNSDDFADALISLFYASGNEALSSSSDSQSNTDGSKQAEDSFVSGVIEDFYETM